MRGFNAIAPGTDLPAHARSLHRTRSAVIGGDRPPEHPRTLVARSWSRVLEMGVDPDGANPRLVLPLDQIERRRRESPLAPVVDELRRMLADVAEASQCLMVITDADGVILWRDGATRIRMRADSLGFGEGASWTERAVGTNAIGTAIAEAQPVELFAAEHFEKGQLPWYCTAAPIHDPRTGAMLGVVDVSGPALTLHPLVGALVASAVRLAEMRLARYHEQSLERLRASAGPRVAGASGPLLLVDEDGWVAHSAGLAARERVAAPVEDRALTVPGLGVCLPEPVRGGWLVRPCGDTTTVALRLDLSGPPALEVTGGSAPWRSPLSTRHAEILLSLYLAGPAGLSASALSRALHGDGDHVVSTRAEVSRLRRAVGSVVASRPYRIEDGVRLTVDTGGAERLDDCAFVRTSASHGVRALLPP
ncbi:GAF domain-containing protein [Nocardiopsis nanhaiensis]